MNAIRTKHNLDFEVAEWNPSSMFSRLILSLIPNDKNEKYYYIKWQLFRVGTCEGQWRSTPDAYEILSVINSVPGNGHFEDVLQWFEYGCKRSKLPLRIRAFTNDNFKNHLIGKRGFHQFGEDVEKYFHIIEVATCQEGILF